MHTNLQLWMPLLVILAVFSIPLTALILKYKSRKLLADERRVMIEKGMVPPPIEEGALMLHGWSEEEAWNGNGAKRLLGVQRSLRSGIILTALGLGFAAACFLPLLTGDSLLPRRGPFAFLPFVAVILTFLGLGNLVYYAIAKNELSDGKAPDGP